jgi:hypothetical protein
MPMPMPRMQVANVHGFIINKIAKLEAHTEKPYARQTLTGCGGYDFSGYPCANHSSGPWMFARLSLNTCEPVEQARRGFCNRSRRPQPKPPIEETHQNVHDAIIDRSTGDHGYSNNRHDTLDPKRYTFDVYGNNRLSRERASSSYTPTPYPTG